MQEAAYRGSMERLNPVLMTTLSAGLAMAGGEPGNEIQGPMTVVVLGGLPTAVVLNMLVVPALFLRSGVDRPGTAGAATPRWEPKPVLEGVG